MAKFQYFKSQDLRKYILRCFAHWGIPSSDAQIAAEILLSADKRGIDSHGIGCLFSLYGSRLKSGAINPTASLTVMRETASTLTLDGGNGLGHPISYKAMKMVIDKARLNSLAFATVRNSNHFGIAGYYAMMALPNNMIGICMTNSGPLMAPTRGRKAMLGSNPIAVAVPARNELPFVLDMATSIVPIGRVESYEREHRPIPTGWGIDADGMSTNDPARVINVGALLPLGGMEESKGYKGYGLAMVVDILSGILAGAAFGDKAYGEGENAPANIGHFFGAISIDAFRDSVAFKMDMDELITRLKGSPKAAGEERILIHGEKEFEQAARSELEGIGLSQATVELLNAGGKDFGIPFTCVPIHESD